NPFLIRQPILDQSSFVTGQSSFVNRQSSISMRHPNLRSLLETLKREGELHVIEETINPHLELAEIHRRVVARQGPALLFTHVAGTKFPVVTNLFGTRRRIDLAFREDP